MSTWKAAAKINVFLHIISKRADGLHNLQTIFQLLDYYDELSFECRADGNVYRTSKSDIKQSDDLVVKAANLLKEYTKTTLGVDIAVSKKIPIGAGLGGGSSNAATTLLALNELWDLNITKEELMKLGSKLGADVPIFIFGYSAWAEGIGDNLTKIKLPNNWFLIVFSGKGISTKKIFSHPLLTISKKQLKITSFFTEDKKLFSNDCLLAAIDVQGEIQEIIDWLNTSKNSLENAKMTGTGACVFVSFAKENDAISILKKLPKKWLGFVAKGVNEIPSKEVSNM